MAITDDIQKAILAKIPADKQALAAQFVPGVVQMAATSAAQWCNYFMAGDYVSAYRLYVASTDQAGLLSAWDKNNADMDTANAANAESIQKQKDLAKAICQGVILPILAAVVGL